MKSDDLSAVEDLDSPTLKQALKSSSKQQWVEEISEEFESLQEVDTWDIVSHPPPGKRIFPSNFVLKIKRNSDRTIERYKARLVLLGHLQQKDVDFFETQSCSRFHCRQNRTCYRLSVWNDNSQLRCQMCILI
jgi:hypothetical protein